MCMYEASHCEYKQVQTSKEGVLKYAQIDLLINYCCSSSQKFKSTGLIYLANFIK